MRPYMRLRLMFAAVLLTAAAYAQTAPSSTPAPQQDQKKEELPSAPSATPKEFPGAQPAQQAPAPAPSTAAPAQTTAPTKKATVDTSSDDVPLPSSQQGQTTAPPSGGA